MDNKFILTIPCRNVEDWIETNLNSVLCQTYPHWEVIYINDASTDKTDELYHQIVGDNPKFRYVKHDERQFSTRVPVMESITDPDIIWVELDGDDWLATEDTLERYNEFYNQMDPWITYGRMLVWEGEENLGEANPQNTPYPELVKKYGLYRRDIWRASHLRTFRNFLWRSWDKSDMRSIITGKDFVHGGDLALMYPMMEMCPPDKVQPVPFFSVVWNAHPSKMVHTKEREKSDNSIYEQEIRFGKPRYKQVRVKEDLKGEKLPTINVFGDYCERHSILTNASYVYGINPGFGNIDVTVFHDAQILRYLNGEIKVPHGKVVAQVMENPTLGNQQQVYEAVNNHADKFDLILSWHKDLLRHPNAKLFPLAEMSQWSILPEELDEGWFQVYPKSKDTSFVSSGKTLTPGHVFRLNCFDHVRRHFSSQIDFFGRDFNPIKSKLEALKDYRFSIAMENESFDNYFTEKILDCFLAGTIPIYYGAKNIGSFFDINGILAFDTLDELISIISTLNESVYLTRMDAVRNNYETASKTWMNNNRYFDRYIKPLLI